MTDDDDAAVLRCSEFLLERVARRLGQVYAPDVLVAGFLRAAMILAVASGGEAAAARHLRELAAYIEKGGDGEPDSDKPH